MIKAILFDMDGVLVNSLKTHYYAFNTAITKYGAEKISLKTFKEKIWGTYIEQNVKAVFGNISAQALKEITEEYTCQMEKYEKHTEAYPETKKVLSELKKRNLKLALVTSTPEKTADTMMRQASLSSYFDVAVYGDQVQKPKPAPDGIIKACNSLGIQPSEAIYVGDNPQDIVAGKAAGCIIIGITKTNSRETLKDADTVIDNLAQLLAVSKNFTF